LKSVYLIGAEMLAAKALKMLKKTAGIDKISVEKALNIKREEFDTKYLNV
jgi:hypothetical protein